MAQKPSAGPKVKVRVRTDAVFHDGAYHHYDTVVELPVSVAKRLIESGRVEKV